MTVTATAGKVQRNPTVDILRGVAMLMVVLGHTMASCTEGSEKTFLYNVIWTLQMPLFMLISGYVSKFSRSVTSARDLGRFIGRRTLAYLLPWAVWTFLVRGLIFDLEDFRNIKFVLFHMDTGYWFLFSIWNIAMIFGAAQFMAERLCRTKRKYTKLTVLTLVYVLGMALLAALGLLMGLSFLCIKLTLYYMPFYFAGFLFGQLEEDLLRLKYGPLVKEAAVALSLVGWIALMWRFDFYLIEDNIIGILLRASASLMGCIAVCGLLSKLVAANTGDRRSVSRFLNWVGIHSLEIFLVHEHLLGMIQAVDIPAFGTAEGVWLTVFNYAVTVASTCGIICLIHQNRLLTTVLFGKITKSKGA